MKKFALVAVIAALSAAPAFANMELAQKKSCLACHAVDYGFRIVIAGEDLDRR